MIADFGELFFIGFQTLLILLVLLLFFRNHIISVFDPLFFYLVTQAFSIELAFLTTTNSSALINFICCQLFFIAGFLVFSGKSLKKRTISNNTFLQPALITLSAIKVFAVSVTFIIIFANIYLISQKGIALFADDPSAAKGENFVGGGGIGFIRRINWGIIYLCSLFLIYLILIKKKLTYVILALLLIVVLILLGSKGVLLYFITLIPLLSKFPYVKQLKTLKWLNLSKYILLSCGIFIALIIVSVGSEGTFEGAIFKLFTRFLFFGDAMLYYYDDFSIRHFVHYNLIDFLYNQANPVLGFFRIVPYQRPLGFELVEYQFSLKEDTVFGPNVPYYVSGHIFFGSIGAIVYSFIIGGIVGWVRSLFYRILETPKNIFVTLLIIHLNLTIYNMPQDSQLFISITFDTFIQAAPIYFIIYLFLRKGVLNTEQLIRPKSPFEAV